MDPLLTNDRDISKDIPIETVEEQQKNDVFCVVR
jgi:hypothetical protein